MKYTFLLSFFCIVQSLIATSFSDSLKQKINDNPDQSAHFHFLIARNFYNQTYGYAANQDSVLYYLNVATQEAINQKSDTTLARCHMFMGKTLSRAGLFAESNETFLKARAIYSALGDSLYVSKMDYTIAYNYLDLGMYHKGIPHLESAIQRSNNSADTHFTASMNLAMGSFLTAMKKFEESRSYTKTAIQLLNDSKQIEIGGAYHNLARSFGFQAQYDSAYHYYQKALSIWKNINYQRGEGVLYTNISEFFTQQEQYDRAIDYLLKSEKLLIEIQDKRRLKDTYLKIADNYLHLNMPKKAMSYVQKAEDQGLEHSPFSFFHELDRLKAKTYEQLGDFKKAYQHQIEFLKRADTLVEQQAEQRVLQSDQRLEFLRKTKDLELKAATLKSVQQEKELLQAEQTIYLILLISIILIASFVLFYFNKRKKFEREIYESNLQQSEEQNKQLQKEIDLRHKKLSSYALQLIDKNQKIDDVKKQVENLKNSEHSKEIGNELALIENSIHQAINTEQSWEEFKLYFEEVHTDFFARIKETHPSITSRELRLSALLRLNLSTKEIANLLNLPNKTIEVARYRLRKKFELSQEVKLTDYIISI